MAIATFEELLRQLALGSAPTYLCFWGHESPAPDTVDAACLSQWYPAAFEVEGIRFATTEHYMMWAKALLFGDGETAAQIAASDDPGEAQRLGRRVRGFDEAAWVAARAGIVFQANQAKFGQNPALAAYLLSTGNRVLVNASPWDGIWGVGLGAEDPRIQQPPAWRGLNLLGFTLMRVRASLAQPTGAAAS